MRARCMTNMSARANGDYTRRLSWRKSLRPWCCGLMRSRKRLLRRVLVAMRMRDRESGVFLAATSNNITILPPEMLRKGRFDEIFFVDLPNPQIRAALFALHLKKRGRDAGAFDLAKLAAASDGFSGAEIEQAIIAGLYSAFSAKDRKSTRLNSSH